MTILLGFNQYGNLNKLDNDLINIIKSFLVSTPNEKLIN